MGVGGFNSLCVILLRASDPGVSVSTVRTAAGWRHTLNWATTCYAVCYYGYSVRNVKNGVVHENDDNTMSVRVCANIFQP